LGVLFIREDFKDLLAKKNIEKELRDTKSHVRFVCCTSVPLSQSQEHGKPRTYTGCERGRHCFGLMTEVLRADSQRARQSSSEIKEYEYNLTRRKLDVLFGHKVSVT
jgi:hypothetical protein